MDSPSTRYRGKYVLDHLKDKHNINYDFVFPSYRLANIANFCISYFSALFFRKRHSLIIFQKIYTAGIYATLLKLLLFIRRNNTIYDLDDAEYLRFPDKTMNHFLRNCSSAFLGSKELLKYASKFNKSPLLLTSPVAHYQYSEKHKNERLTIGWIGDYGTGKEISREYSHEVSLKKLFFPAIKALDIPLKIMIIGVHTKEDSEEIMQYFSSNRNLIIEIPLNINWLDEASINRYINQFDIGVSPMVDHEFNRAKSAFKIKQYFACGVPALASPVGENNTFLKEGSNGFFCATVEDFRERIIHFNNMKETHFLEMCINAANALSEFDLDHFCERVINCYEV